METNKTVNFIWCVFGAPFMSRMIAILFICFDNDFDKSINTVGSWIVKQKILSDHEKNTKFHLAFENSAQFSHKLHEIYIFLSFQHDLMFKSYDFVTNFSLWTWFHQFSCFCFFFCLFSLQLCYPVHCEHSKRQHAIRKKYHSDVHVEQVFLLNWHNMKKTVLVCISFPISFFFHHFFHFHRHNRLQFLDIFRHRK